MGNIVLTASILLLAIGLIFALTTVAIYLFSRKPQQAQAVSKNTPWLEPVTSPKRKLPLAGVNGRGDVIGRAMPAEGVTVRITDWAGWETVSRFHARIYRENGYIVVRDLDSQNGVYINGQRTPLNALREGVKLAFGSVEFIYHAS